MIRILKNLGFFSAPIHWLFFINLSFIFGIISANSNCYWPCIIALLLFAAIQPPTQRFKSCFNFVAFCLGILIFNKQQSDFKNFTLSVNNKNFALIGNVLDVCNIEHLNTNNCITFKILKMRETGSSEWIYVNKKIQIYTINNHDIKVDDIIEIPRVNFTYASNESFDKYLTKEELFASLFLYKFRCKLINRPNISIFRFIHNLKNTIFTRLKSKINPSTFPLFSSIFFGNKNDSKEKMEKHKENFKIWGLSHYLARSGLHLVIIASIWFMLISMIKINFKTKSFIISLFIFIYSTLSWSSIPFIRSLIMFALFKICTISEWQSNTLHLLNITCLTILFFNPIQLFFIDFQLSFALTYALIWLSSNNK